MSQCCSFLDSFTVDTFGATSARVVSFVPFPGARAKCPVCGKMGFTLKEAEEVGFLDGWPVVESDSQVWCKEHGWFEKVELEDVA